MRRILVIGFLFCLVSYGQAQTQEAEQLLLNWEKLTQFKKILQNMYDGYKVLHQGYTAIKDISEGNFSLHKTFLDALLEVNPTVRQYKKVKDIIDYLARIAKEYKAAFSEFQIDENFSPEEINYLGKVYGNLLSESLKCLDELFMTITPGNLRMSDDERLQAIDRIYETVEDQFSFLREFNSNTALLSLQRKSESIEIRQSKKILGF